MNKQNLMSTKKTQIYNELGSKIVVETENLKTTKDPHNVTFRLGKNRTTAGVWSEGHSKPYGGVPGVTPFLTPDYFMNPKQFFTTEKMLKYYIKNNITPPFVGDEFDISFKNWSRFKHLYKEAKGIIGNNHLVNRKLKHNVDIRDYILRYINKASLQLGFDTEWSENERDVLSYQFSTTIDDVKVDIVFYPTFRQRLGLGEMMYYIVNHLFSGRGFVVLNEGIAGHHINPFYKTSNVTLIAHFGGVDFSMCKDYHQILSYLNASEKQKNQLFEYRNYVKKGIDKKGNRLSQEDIDKYKKRIEKINKNPVHSQNLIVSDKHCMYTTSPRMYNYWYVRRRRRCMFRLEIRDTMKLSPPGSALLSLGESLGISKLDTNALDKAEHRPFNYYKEHMDVLLKNHPHFFHDYAVRDARISYEWYQNVKNIVGDGVTISAIAGSHLQKNIKETLANYYKGGLSWSKDVVGFNIEDGKPNYNVYSHVRGLFGDKPDYAYIGGRNESFTHGLITGRTYDYDLRSAYPFQMQVLRMIDLDADPISFKEGHVLKLDDWKHFGQAGFGYVDFEFPESVKYPTIPLKSDKANLKGSPVFLRKGYGLVSAPDVFSALQVGAKVTVGKQGFMFFDLKKASEHDTTDVEPFDALDVDKDYPMHPLGFGVRSMIQKRKEYADKYGKKSVQAQLMKILVNSTYGKTGQGIHGNTARNVLNDETEVIPFSKITDGVLASTTTSLVRAVLGLIMNYIDRCGYTVHSVTTDGFISDFPWERMLEIDEYLAGISTVFSKIIKKCWNEELDWSTGKGSILEVKHIQDEFFFNVKTRGNISLDVGKEYINPFTKKIEKYDGVFAKAGYKGDKDFKFLDDYSKRKYLLNEVVNRRGKLVDYQTDMLSFRDVKNSNLKTITKHFEFEQDKQKGLSMDFDKKRMIDERKYSDIITDDFRSNYGYFTTRPFETMEEYEYNADIHSLFITFGHNIKSDRDFLGYQLALERGFPKFKVVNKLYRLTTNELRDYKHKLNKYKVKQFLMLQLLYPELKGGLHYIDVEVVSKKDWMIILKGFFGVDASDMWKNVKKRGKNKQPFDYLTAMRVYGELSIDFEVFNNCISVDDLV